MLEVNVFVGKILNPVDGGRIILPTTREDIDEKIISFHFGESEFEIMDIEHSMPLNLGNYRDIYSLNEDLHTIQKYMEEGLDLLLFTAYAFRDENLGYALKLLEEGNYEYYVDVEDDESLGRQVFESGRFGINPDSVPEKVTEYMDFEKIGLDWTSNGAIIYPNFKTAIMQVSPNY